MEIAIKRFIENKEDLRDIYEDYKSKLLNFTVFRNWINKGLKHYYIKPNWIDKPDSEIWTPAKYEDLSDSEKSIHSNKEDKIYFTS